jgi:hypothetical protein
MGSDSGTQSLISNYPSKTGLKEWVVDLAYDWQGNNLFTDLKA